MKRIIQWMIFTCLFMGYVTSFAEGNITASINKALSNDTAIVIDGAVSSTNSTRLMALVLDSSENINWNEINRDDYTKVSDFGQSVVYMEQINLENGGKWSLTVPLKADAIAGGYQIIIFESAVNTGLCLNYYKANEVENTDCVGAFNGASEMNFGEQIKTFAVDSNILQVPNAEELVTDTEAGKFFVSIRTDEYNGVFTQKSQVEAAIDKALLMKSLKYATADGIRDAIKLYGTYYPETFDAAYEEIGVKYNADFANYFIIVRNDCTPGYNMSEYKDCVKRAVLLAVLDKGTVSDIKSVLDTNAQIMGINQALYNATLKNVSNQEIAKKLYSDDLSTQGTYNKLPSRINDIVAEVSAGLINTGNQNTSSGSGGGRVSGGGAAVSGVGNIPQNVQQTDAFYDLSNVPWAKAAIETLYKREIVSGKGNGYFCPNDSVTREEFVKMAVLGFDLQYERAVCEFSDCTLSDWFYPYVAIAYQQGIVLGVSENKFGAGQTITREDLCVIVSRILQYKGKILEDTENNFVDYQDVSSYAEDAINSLMNAGVLTGYEDGTVRPKNNITRAEAAVIVNRAIKLIEGGIQK